MSDGGAGGVIAVGSCGAPDGTSKAAVLTLDAMGTWEAELLPENGSNPGVERASTTYFVTVTAVNKSAAGVAKDDNADDKPVFWTFNEADGSWSITELPLLPGGISGDVRDGTIDDVDGTVTLVGSSETDPDGLGPVRHAALWQCNHTDDDCDLPSSWTVTDCGVLPGFANSRHYVVTADEDATITTVGSSDDGAGNEVATLWEVDTTVTPATVTVHDLNSLVSDLPGNVTLTGAFAITGRGTVATGRIETGLAHATAGVSDPHAFFLETVEPAIPAASTWGLAAMLLLMMTMGTIVITRQRWSQAA